MRVHEVPVDWVDDPDSRVRVLRTAIDDLRGVARLALGGQVWRFALVGVASTLAYAVLYLALRTPLGAQAANALALVLTACAVAFLHAVAPGASHVAELGALLAASAAATALRYVALRFWVFARAT